MVGLRQLHVGAQDIDRNPPCCPILPRRLYYLLTTVLHGPLQPLTREGDSTHPSGFFRDGHCWGSDEDPGEHFIGAVVTDDFLKFSKNRGAC